MECRFPVQGQAGKPRRDRPQPCGALSGRRSVRQTGDRVRVNAQLVDADGQVLWSPVSTRRLRTSLPCRTRSLPRSPAHWRSASRRSNNAGCSPSQPKSRSLRLCVARQASIARPTRANMSKARALLRRAIELDPNYAAAYAALAETYHIAHPWDGRNCRPITWAARRKWPQGAEPRRYRCACARHPRPHPHFLSPIRPGRRRRSTVRSRSIRTTPSVSPAGATS